MLMIRSFVCAVLLLAAAHHHALASPLMLNSGNDYAPYAGENLPEGGMITDIVKNVFKVLNQDIKIDWMPWLRGYKETLEGRYAATFPYLLRPYRDKVFLYSDPLYVLKDVIFTRPGSGIDAGNLETLHGKVMCLPIGWAPAKSLEPLVQKNMILREQPRDISLCAQMVAHGRADFFATDAVQGSEVVKAAHVPAGSIVQLPTVLDTDGLYLIASRANPASVDLLKRFNAGLHQIKANGTYANIIAAHSK